MAKKTRRTGTATTSKRNPSVSKASKRFRNGLFREAKPQK